VRVYCGKAWDSGESISVITQRPGNRTEARSVDCGKCTECVKMIAPFGQIPLGTGLRQFEGVVLKKIESENGLATAILRPFRLCTCKTSK